MGTTPPNPHSYSYLQPPTYQQAIDLDASLSAQLNRFNPLIQTGQLDEASQQAPVLHQAIQQFSTGRTAVYATIYSTTRAGYEMGEWGQCPHSRGSTPAPRPNTNA